MEKQQNIQQNYTTLQLQLPLDLGIKIPNDDELVSYLQLMKGVNLNSYFSNNSSLGRNKKNRVAILHTILFGFMVDVRSTRAIEKRCKTDIRFMYLLDKFNLIDPPSHSLINKVIKSLENDIDTLFTNIINSIKKMI